MRRFYYINPKLNKLLFLLLLLFLFIYLINTDRINKVLSSSLSLTITEIFPDAIGSDSGKEWVEIFNPLSSDININGWYIKNISQSGGTRTIQLPDILIKSHEYLVISELQTNLSIDNIYYLSDTLLNLYNTNSKLELYNSNSELQDIFEYIGGEGSSVQRDGPLCNSYSVSQNFTPGINNINYSPECFELSSDNIPEEENEEEEENEADILAVNLKLNELFKTYNNLYIELENIDGVEVLNLENYRVVVNGKYVEESLSCVTKWCYFNVTITNDYFVDKVEVYFKEILLDSIKTANDLIVDNSYSRFKDIWQYTPFNTVVSDNILKEYSQIYITEVYPSPENGEEEWIEIFNYSGIDLELSSFYLKERISNGDYSSTKNFLEDRVIKSNTHYSISGFNLTLNNSGDKVGLFLNDVLIDQVIYPSIGYSKSYLRKFNNTYLSEWVITTESSRGEFNITQSITNDINDTDKFLDYKSYSNILELKSLNKGSKVKFRGCLNINIGVISENVTYLEDTLTGIRVKFNQAEDLILNDCVEVLGRVSTYKNEKYIAIEKYSKLDSVLENIYIKVDLNNLSDLDIGKLITFNGYITRKYSTSFKVNNILSVYPLEFFLINDLEKEVDYQFKGILSKENNKYMVYIVSEDGIEESNILGISSTPLSYTKVDNDSPLFNEVNENSILKVYTWPIYLIINLLSLGILNIQSLKPLFGKIMSF